MVFSRTEINLSRLLASAPNQKNHAKLVHYIASMREQLEQLEEERNPDGLPRVSKTKINEYSAKIEEIASKLTIPEPEIKQSNEPTSEITLVSDKELDPPTSPGLRRRNVPSVLSREKHEKSGQNDAAVKLDDEAKANIEKHRKLQEDLTDDMVGLARQLKERSIAMHQSVKETEKILDSTEGAIEQSLAGTGRANVRATEIYSKSSKTTCFTWLLMFVMTCVFIMVVLLIRVT